MPGIMNMVDVSLKALAKILLRSHTRQEAMNAANTGDSAKYRNIS